MPSDEGSSPAFDELPPSCRYVLHILLEEQPLTFQDMVEETDLPKPTARWALRRLKNCSYISTDRDPKDLRRNQYKIRDKTNR